MPFDTTLGKPRATLRYAFQATQESPHYKRESNSIPFVVSARRSLGEDGCIEPYERFYLNFIQQ